MVSGRIVTLAFSAVTQFPTNGFPDVGAGGETLQAGGSAEHSTTPQIRRSERASWELGTARTFLDRPAINPRQAPCTWGRSGGGYRDPLRPSRNSPRPQVLHRFVAAEEIEKGAEGLAEFGFEVGVAFEHEAGVVMGDR